MKLLFLIATYQRPRMLGRLLYQIHRLCPTQHRIIVVDDGSDKDYSSVQSFLSKIGGQYFRLGENYGRKEYHKVVDILFKRAALFEWDYVFKLDDDINLHPDTFKKAIPILDHLSERRDKVVLNMWVDHRADKSVWTNIEPKIIRTKQFLLRKVGWIDAGNWAATRSVLETLGWDCPVPPEKWWRGPGDSSGVGKYLSRELSRKACPIFMPMQSLIYHGAHPSMMHPSKTNRPIEMKQKPWEK